MDDNDQHPVFMMDSALGDAYECGEQLGAGAFAEVRLCRHRESGEERAIKIVNKKRFSLNTDLRKGSWIDEVNILKSLDHPSIVQIINVFNSRKYLCIVMELIRGGDLFDAVITHTRYPEDKARETFRQMCEALKYLHDREIVHRDLKPENFLLLDTNADNEIKTGIKMADFGLAKVLGEKAITRTLCGTPQYLAPEVIQYAQMHDEEEDDGDNGYGKAVDVWSLGCVLFILLVGFPPFKSRDDILSGCFRLTHNRWNTVSTSAKDLIQHMLVTNPEKRYTVDQCLKHHWLTT